MFVLTERVSLRVVVEQADCQEQISQVVFHGQDLGEPVPAVRLEVAYVWKERYLLVFATADCPYEETVYIYLFDLHANRLLDKAALWFWGLGFFTEPKVLSSSRVSFIFFPDSFCKVELLDSPRHVFRNIFGKEIGYIWRPFAKKRYFVVTHET